MRQEIVTEEVQKLFEFVESTGDEGIQDLTESCKKISPLISKAFNSLTPIELSTIELLFPTKVDHYRFALGVILGMAIGQRTGEA